MSDVAAWLAPRLPAGRDLDRAELGDVARELGCERTVWQHLVRHDPDERYFVELHRDVHLDVWLTCRTNQQDTGYLGHYDFDAEGDVCRTSVTYSDETLTGRVVEISEFGP